MSRRPIETAWGASGEQEGGIMVGEPLLKGVRICDFTLHAAGPYCTHFLSLLGAECIKIESAAKVDIHRRAHPVYGRPRPSKIDQGNVNKLGITLNLKTDAGRALAIQLARASDIVAESFRPGVIERLGLGYDVLRQDHESLVMISVSNSGRGGPESAEPGYAPIFAALGGLGTLTGYCDGPPVEMRNMMDNVTGMMAAFATLSGIYQCRKTGRGCHIDVAAREVASCFIGDAIAAACDPNAPEARRQGNEMPGLAPHGVFPCKGYDQWVSIAVGDDSEWEALVGVLELDSVGDREEFRHADGRSAHREELKRVISEVTRRHDKIELADRLQTAGVPAFASYSAADIVADEHLRERGTIIDFVQDGHESLPIVGAPWRIDGRDLRPTRWSPALGEHNDYVFRDILGLSEERVRVLQDEGVIM